jgi:hypothetical protein
MDAWYTALQWMSFVILGLTVAIGVVLSGRQKAEIGELTLAVAKANKAAADANERAGNANERAAALEREAAEFRQRAATLEQEAAAARLELEHIKERQTQRRVPIEELMVRAIMFDGMEVAITSAMDDESALTGGQIKHALTGAGWKILKAELSADAMFSGISVWGPADRTAGSKATKAQARIVDLLNANGLKAGVTSGGNFQPAENELWVEVGPNPQFLPHGYHPFMERSEVKHEFVPIEPLPFPPGHDKQSANST